MKYYTTENKLTGDGKFTARVITDKNYTEDELIDKMLRKRNIVSRPDLRGVISALKETVVEIVREGNGLNLPWLKIGYSMKGNFDTPDTVRSPDRNPLEINANAGAMLTDVLSEVRPERVSVPDFGPRILRFTDGVSETSNSQMTPGGVFSIIGERLRIDGRQPGTFGLYLQAEDGTETRVDVLLRNDPAYLSGQLPSTLASGTYQLVVKTQIGASNQFVVDVRTSTSSFSLTVQ
jgi:hypothetical protein